MPRGRKLASLTLTDEQQNQLQGIAQSATLPYALVVRARIILASAEGLTNAAVAKRVGATPHTVGKWRRRFREAGIQGLHDEIRPGRPRTYDDDKVASVINRALQETPDTATHWSTRALGQAAGISKSTVQRWLFATARKRRILDSCRPQDVVVAGASSDRQVPRVLAGVKARRCAPPPLSRGSRP